MTAQHRSRRGTRTPLLASLLTLPLLACGSAGEATPDASSEPAEGAPSSASSPDELPSDVPRFVGQEGWVSEAPSSSFRSVQWRLLGDEGVGDAELYICPFPGGVGTLESNLDRWASEVGVSTPAAQLPADQRWETTTREFVVTTVYVKGVLKGMAGVNPDAPTIEDGAVHASYIERVGSPSVWTVKARGPAATVAKHEKAIEAFLAGI